MLFCKQKVKIMKLPNGYGTVYKLSGKRRKPYIARKTIGWEINEETKKSKQILKTIGYYKTKSEALQALADYNSDPYDLIISKYTFAEIYEKWFEETFNDDSNKSTMHNYKNAYSHCESIYNKPIISLRLADLQKVLNEAAEQGYKGSNRIRSLMNGIYKWCIRNEYLKKNYAEMLILPKVEKPSGNERRAILPEHLERIWACSSSDFVSHIVLILIYSGVRPNELFNLKKEDVHLDEQWFQVRKSKTESGIRIVPIADKVLPLWKEAISNSKCEYAITNVNGEFMGYDNFRKRYWTPFMQRLDLDYTVYETRHTCNSLLIMADCNPTVRKKIMGHKSKMDLGENVYGHIYIEKLIEAINLI